MKCILNLVYTSLASQFYFLPRCTAKAEVGDKSSHSPYQICSLTSHAAVLAWNTSSSQKLKPQREPAKRSVQTIRTKRP